MRIVADLQRYPDGTQLYYFRYRWYDPAVGRFITRDPIGIWGDSINNGNGYAYVGNNPWSMVDPLGLEGDCPTVMDFGTALQQFGPGTLKAIKKNQWLDPTGGELYRFLNNSDPSLQKEQLRRIIDRGNFNNAIIATNLSGTIGHDLALAVLGELATGTVAPVGEVAAARAFERGAEAYGAYRKTKALTRAVNLTEKAIVTDTKASRLGSQAAKYAETNAAREGMWAREGKVAGDCSLKHNRTEPPSGESLSRLGTSRESATRLGKKASEAEEKIGIHGVSVSAGQPIGPASQAAREAVESKFPVYNTPTRNDPLHRTVELPKPVTPEVAKEFNDVFGRK